MIKTILRKRYEFLHKMMQKIRLKSWVALLTIVPTILITSAILSYFSHQRYVELDQLLVERAKAVVEPLAITVAPLISENKLETLHQLISVTHRSQSTIIRSILVFDRKNNLIVTSDHGEISHQMQVDASANIPIKPTFTYENNTIILRTPIFNEGATHFITNTNNAKQHIKGYLAVRIDQHTVKNEQQQLLLEAIAIIVIALLISMACVLQLVSSFTRPINSMLSSVDRIREGKLESRISGQLVGELNFLKNGINAMAQSLCDNHEEMQRNIDQATIDLRESLEQFEIHNVELDIAKRKAQEANKVKSQFLANMSHELRTPLNAVIGFTRQVLKTRLSNTQRDYLQTIERSAANLLAIISDILDFSKLDAGKVMIEKIPFSIRETVEEAINLLAPSAHKKNVELSLKVTPQLTDSLIGDALRIKQIMINLASNAIKFTNQGSVNIDIESELISNNMATIKVSVNDTGIGMSVEQQEKIFEVFGQADKSVTRLYGGTGLGLVISQRLASEMNGDIGFVSDVRNGSTFWFTFQCEINPIPDESKWLLPSLKGKHILYFEQHPHSRVATIEMLENWHMRVSPFTSLEQVSNALLNDIEFDYALIGHDVTPNALPELKQLIASLQHHIPAIHLAINSNSPIVQETLIALGVQSCLSKPLTALRLSKALAPQHFNSSLYLEENLQNKIGIKVLAVDDNDTNLKLIRTLLSEQVTEVITATDGKEALELCKKEKFSLIFMDIQMPNMDGISASKHIKKYTENKSTPMIAVTAHALSGEKGKLLQQGFDSYLAKPIDETMLRNSIYEYCDLHFPDSINKDQLLSQPDYALADPNRQTVTIKSSVDDNSRIIDWPLAIQRAGNKIELAKDMLRGLVTSLPETKQLISEALTLQDTEQLKTLVHKLNGACCYSGVPNLGEMTHHIESQLKKGVGIDDLEPEFFEFFDHIDSVIKHAPVVLKRITSTATS